MTDPGGAVEVLSIRPVYEGYPVRSLEVHRVRLPNGVERDLELVRQDPGREAPRHAPPSRGTSEQIGQSVRSAPPGTRPEP